MFKRIFLIVALLLAILGLPEYTVVAEDVATMNLRQGEAWLSQKELEDGVAKTDTGLLYKVLRKGTSNISPSRTDRVKVHYRGSLIDGKEFDSSYSRNQPLTFGLNQVIPGWTEGLQLMSVGDKYELYIPSKLGYGPRGAGGAIPGNAALVFEVELLDVVGKTHKEDL